VADHDNGICHGAGDRDHGRDPAGIVIGPIAGTLVDRWKRRW